MNHQVVIPSSFFLNEAKHEYHDVQTRLVQELLQNSLDAGANRIVLTFSDSGYVCDDNGRGMTQERMVNALLTMGGSVKDSGATGGFGAAKKLLLFAHKEFSIHSNSTAVRGSGLNYQFVNNGVRTGTRVEATYANSSDFGSMEYNARRLLQKCNFSGRARIYVNGELFDDYVTARHAHTVEGVGEVFANKNRSEGENTVLVLHNGLYMFDRYIYGLNRKVVVMVSAPSTEVFTQNRDSFKGDVRNKFDAFISKLTVDKKSVVKPKPRKFVLEGVDAFVSYIAKSFNITPAIQAAINQIRLNAGSYTAASLAEAIVAKIESSPVASNGDRAIAASIVTFVRNNNANLQTDFHFDLSDSSYRKVPAKYMPNVGMPKFTNLAKTWKVCVREVLKANNLSQDFVIGFTFNSNAVATHQKKEGVSCYLINPESAEIDNGTKEERIMKVLTTAVHEVVHSQGCDQHDEEFVRKFHDLLIPTLTKGLTWRSIVKEAKNEKV